MVTIRLQRRGTKKTPHHRIVVMDQRSAQGSRVLEVVGYYDPSTQPVKFRLDDSRRSKWLSNGARVSEAVQKLLWAQKKLAAKSA